MTRSRNDIGRRNGGFSLLKESLRRSSFAVVISSHFALVQLSLPILRVPSVFRASQAAVFTLLHQIYPPRGYDDAFQLPLNTAEAEARSPRGFAKPDIHCR